jgi:hypothetical protein
VPLDPTSDEVARRWEERLLDSSSQAHVGGEVAFFWLFKEPQLVPGGSKIRMISRIQYVLPLLSDREFSRETLLGEISDSRSWRLGPFRTQKGKFWHSYQSMTGLLRDTKSTERVTRIVQTPEQAAIGL